MPLKLPYPLLAIHAKCPLAPRFELSTAVSPVVRGHAELRHMLDDSNLNSDRRLFDVVVGVPSALILDLQSIS